MQSYALTTKRVTRFNSFHQPWRSWEFGDWETASVTLVCRKSTREKPGNYRPVNLTSVPGKVMENVILNDIEKAFNEQSYFQA